MKVEDIPVNDLEYTEYNPRSLSEKQRADIKASLERFGFVDPAIRNTHPDRENKIVGGNQRVKVAVEDLGYEYIPCTPVNLDLEQEKELNIRLNKNSGDWDFKVLEDQFEGDDLIDWGFAEEELPWLNAELEDFFKEPEETTTTKTKDSPTEKIILELSPENAENVRSELQHWDEIPENAVMKILGLL